MPFCLPPAETSRHPHRSAKPTRPIKSSTTWHRAASRSSPRRRPDFSAPSSVEAAISAAPVQFATASRYRVYNREAERVLPVGRAPERGLQVKTILVARSISALFPEIQNIGGVRPDSLRWHPDGLALDVMIPNPSSAAGIALGNRIVEFALENADRFDLQDCIWRGMYYTPSGAKAGGYGHYDHVHITTHGGGYPSGDEVYIR